MNGFTIRVVAGTVLVLGTGCADLEPLGVGQPDEQPPPNAQAALACAVTVRTGALACNAPRPQLPSGLSGALIGGQGVYVQLDASQVSYDAGSSTFGADVTLRNLLDQTLGVVEVGGQIGADPDGIRIFFLDEPEVTSGTGTVTVANNSGTASFTMAGQAYFQYAQALSPGRRSLPMRWLWNVPATVESFTFEVAVNARVSDEDAVNPGLAIDAATIGAGKSHSCGLTLGGALHCWGSNGNGRLGTGDLVNYLTPAPVDWTATGADRIASITAGNDHTCALSTTGKAYCWGSVANGRLGIGDTITDRVTPVEVLGGHTFIALDAGAAHTCGVTPAGAAYCWGLAQNGRLGEGTTDSVAVATPALVHGGHQFVSISSGRDHTCGLTTTGAAYCWGLSQYGTPPPGTIDSVVTSTPTLVAGGQQFTSISAGGVHTCGITTSGAAYCWGNNAFGQLGDGSGTDKVEPVAVAGGHRFASISAGGVHTCGLTTAGKAYCWGYGFAGQLGDGSVADYGNQQLEPVEVLGGHTFVSISAGELHTCAVTADGTMYCWGDGAEGQLGDGSSDPQTVPVPVVTVTNFALLEEGQPWPTDPDYRFAGSSATAAPSAAMVSRS